MIKNSSADEIDNDFNPIEFEKEMIIFSLMSFSNMSYEEAEKAAVEEIKEIYS